jgi:hypothetical protein
MGDAAECRPVLLTFLFLSRVKTEVTNLPSAGSSPCYSATFACHRA